MGRSFVILLMVMLAGAAAHASPATPAMISEILAALDKGDAQQAAALSETALKEENNSASEKARLLLYHGLARELLGQHSAALRDLTLSLDSHALPAEERGQALLQRGFLHDGLGQLEEALSDYSAAAALKDYNTATALNNRANIYRRRNRLGEARRDYLAALSADGGQPQYSYYGLGQIAESQGDMLGARSFYAKALIAEPGYFEASQRLAALGGPPEGAIAVPSERIVLKPPRGASDKLPIDKKEPDQKPEKKEPKKGLSPTAGLIPIPHHPLTPINALVLRPALDQSDPPSHGSGEIQLGAWRSAAEAQAGWDKAKARAQGTLDGLEPLITDADLPGKGRYFRLRVSPKQSRAEICARLAAKGVACIPVRD
jgi:tetratricopeptide (TPR) repeat protein